ncbi:MAG: hypothetical protein ACWIPJ_01290 [Polaribacter sp.]
MANIITMISTSLISTQNFFKNAQEKVFLNIERKNLLLSISKEITIELTRNKKVNLNFICTHNARRSQLSQIWSFYAAQYFNLNIYSFSGGTQTTAFYRNTVKTLQKAGFNFQVSDFSHQNPTYLISFKGCKNNILVFSKRFDHPENKEPYIAITTCNTADKNCPFIPDAIHQFHLPFIDPKFADGTTTQEETYLKISEQIAAEIYFIFADVKRIVG